MTSTQTIACPVGLSWCVAHQPGDPRDGTYWHMSRVLSVEWLIGTLDEDGGMAVEARPVRMTRWHDPADPDWDVTEISVDPSTTDALSPAQARRLAAALVEFADQAER